MNRIMVLGVICIALIGILGTALSAAVPELLNYQGRLTTPAGLPVPDGTYPVRFTIYDDSLSGVAQWAETLQVTTNTGLFNVQLGSVHPVQATVFASANRWLGIAVGVDPEINPRTRFTSVAYALQSGTDAIGLWSVNGENIYRDHGLVGINTNSPTAKLDVVNPDFTNNVLRLKGLTSAETRLVIEDSTGGFGLLAKSDWDLAGFSIANKQPGNHLNLCTTEGDINLRIHPESGATWEDESLTKLHIDGTTGNIGIGTSTPTQKLQVNGGNLQFTNGDNPYTLMGGIRFGTSYNNWDDWSGVEGWSDGGLDQADLRFYTSYLYRTERMRITPYGNVCIGKVNSEYKFDVNGGICCTGLTVNGDLCVTGQKNAIVPTSQGMTKVYSEESAECWFSDYGEGRLVNGKAHIDLDPIFLETITVDKTHPMQVYLQEYDTSNGLVVKRGMTGFDVIEKENGKSNASFGYRIVAKRKGQESARLQPVETASSKDN